MLNHYLHLLHYRVPHLIKVLRVKKGLLMEKKEVADIFEERERERERESNNFIHSLVFTQSWFIFSQWNSPKLTQQIINDQISITNDWFCFMAH